MKKIISYIAVIILTASCVHYLDTTKNIDHRSGIIIDKDLNNNYTVETYDYNTFTFNSDKNYHLSQSVVVEFDNQGTEDVEDDIILRVK